ncbi:aggregation-promoting factor C-terminal-like domain-containing protein [Glycomyces dulcitolivorans]|uniref:aggregation-promoting factor C-terminal-like domain-containing protein n=1 Tax=Glycomyces dulcitolivorans TaxID=2200759 RepID=UPI000DD49AAB|nr:lytic transglycosylase domain-containing protein [Glycomyces dulcitolivorans]
MLPKLTRHAARIAAVLVLALGAVIAVMAATDRPSDEDAQHPSNAAAENQADAEAAFDEARSHHLDYIAATAGADVTVKAAAVAEYASDKAQGLDDAQEDADQAAEEAAANTNPTSVEIPSSCDEFSGNRATGCAITLERGYDLEQFACLELLWSKESGWNELAENSLGAYGIPQSYPGSKMASEGDDWRTNPVTQILWGLGYIEGKYGTPCDAWAYSEAEGFY